MNYVFFGTPDFSAHCLEILLKHGLIPRAVVCNPDRPVGRKQIVMAPPVKITAERWNTEQRKNIQILQPEKLDQAFIETLKSLNADFFLVFAYNKIFRKDILAVPRLGTVGVHPSFLPEYRGPSPFQTALLDGKTKTGVTLYLLDEGIDSGPLLAASKPVEIADTDDFRSLALKLAEAGAELLLETLPKFVGGEIKPQLQEEARATFTKKFKAEDGFVEANDLEAAEQGKPEQSEMILRKIRAFNPEPGCWTIKNGKRIKLLQAKQLNSALQLLEIQEEGQKAKTVSHL